MKRIAVFVRESLTESPRTSPNPESGDAFLISEFFTFGHAVNWQLGKQTPVPFCALSGQTRAFQFQLAGPLVKKISKVVAPRDTKQHFRAMHVGRGTAPFLSARQEPTSMVSSSPRETRSSSCQTGPIRYDPRRWPVSTPSKDLRREEL